LFYV